LNDIFNAHNQQEIKQNQCSNWRFGVEGDVCDSSPNSRLNCKAFLQCREGKCRSSQIGSFCNRHTDCYLNRDTEDNIRCIGQRCTKRRYPGGDCAMNDECFSQRCRNGVCVGKERGESCDPYRSVECDRNLYCSYWDGICVSQLVEKEDCDDYYNQRNIPDGSNYYIMCGSGTQCIRRTDTGPYACEKVGQKNIDDECDFETDCIWPSRCRNRKCVLDSIADITCVGSRNCTRGQITESCVCGENGAANTCQKSENDNCNPTKTTWDWRNCWAENNCPYEKSILTALLTDPFQKETCMGKYCGHIPLNYLCCIWSGYDYIKFSVGSTLILPCSSAGSIVLILSILTFIFCSTLIITVIVAVVIILLRRRKTNTFENNEEFENNNVDSSVNNSNEKEQSTGDGYGAI